MYKTLVPKGARRSTVSNHTNGKKVTLVTQEKNGTSHLYETDHIIESGRSYDDTTALRLYLIEASRTPLLTRKEEKELARRYKKGDMEARERMICANLRLVVKIAHDYEKYGLPLLDIINEGNIGLMKAVEHFDPSRGAKLSTYASYWIKQTVRRALSTQAKTIRLPVHVVDKLFRIRKTAMKLAEVLEREPTIREIHEETGIPIHLISSYRESDKILTSLDMQLSDHDVQTLGDIIEDENVVTADSGLDKKMSISMVTRYLDTLSPREITIIRLRFGLDGDNEKTLEEVGQIFKVTRERIRQIQDKALLKLRRKMLKAGIGKN